MIGRLVSLNYSFGLLLLAACSSNPDIDSGLRPAQQGNAAATANLNLAVAYMRRGEYERALEKLARARRADPKYHATYNAYGLLYEQLGEADEAERNFKKALSLNATDSAAWNNYGGFLCRQGRLRRAEEAFIKAAENPLYATPEAPLSNIGRCLYINGQMAEAEAYFIKALEINPAVAIALLNMSEIYFARQDYRSAQDYMQRYAAAAGHTADSLLLGIHIARGLGDADAAASYALQLRNNFPDSPARKQLDAMGIR